jgi:cathepsin C
MKNVHSFRLITSVFLLIACTTVQADLPVHCLKSQITGKWEVIVESPKLTGMGPLPCGHSIPD